MNPKEKAKGLVEKYLRVEDDTLFYWEPYYDKHYTYEEVMPHAKKCALICIDELIEAANSGYDYDAEKEIPYLNEVKQEINKL